MSGILLHGYNRFTQFNGRYGGRFHFMTFWTHRAAARFLSHSACLCTVVLISNFLSK
jgi:hypothetical protein